MNESLKTIINGIKLWTQEQVQRTQEQIQKLSCKFAYKEDVKIADWNQSDETAPDFVKNKTHYTAVEDVEVFPETTLSQETFTSNDVAYITANIGDGGSVSIVFDGVVYECVVEGSYGEYHVNAKNGEALPFTIHFSGSNSSNRYIKTTAPFPHTIKGIVAKEVTHPLDKKYIPDIFIRYDEPMFFTEEEQYNIAYTLNHTVKATVNISGSEQKGYTCSHTFSQIKAMLLNGVEVSAKLGDRIYNLYNNGPSQKVFINAGAYGSGVRYSQIYIDSSDEVTVREVYPDLTSGNDAVGKILLVGSVNNTDHLNKMESVYPHEIEYEYLVVKSSTADSTKKFKITVDDTGTISATEYTG